MLCGLGFLAGLVWSVLGFWSGMGWCGLDRAVLGWARLNFWA